MKTLSRRCKYALRALYHLTREYERGPVPVATIAAEEHIPRKFLEAILVQLRNRALVESWKGKQGGYALAKPPSQITLGMVIRILDGPLAPSPCARETAFKICTECYDAENCETRRVLKQVRDAMAAVLDHTTLLDVCESARAEQTAALSFDI